MKLTCQFRRFLARTFRPVARPDCTRGSAHTLEAPRTPPYQKSATPHSAKRDRVGDKFEIQIQFSEDTMSKVIRLPPQRCKIAASSRQRTCGRSVSLEHKYVLAQMTADVKTSRKDIEM